MTKRVLALILAFVFVLPLCALADDGAWDCPNCGQTGNTGNFCSNCATPRPAADWTCPSCGQTGNTGNFCSNCATPRPDGSAAVTAPRSQAAVNPNWEQIPGETDRVRVLLKEVQAGTWIENKKNPLLWVPQNAADNDESTCWQFSAKKLKQGWISLVPQEEEVIDEIWIKNGFWGYNDKGGDQYPLNARAKKVRVAFMYEGTSEYDDPLEFTLDDSTGRTSWQKLAVGGHDSVERIRLTVLSTYKGKSFPNDVCISEVMLVKHAAAESAMAASEQKAATVYESRPDITGCNLTQKLATRSGPGTEYAEPGTFFQKNWQEQVVLVKKKKWDGSIWWVQVDFRNGSKNSYRVWTGAKRVDVDLDKVKEEKGRICDCDIYPTTDTWYGPGGNYARANISINRSACGSIFEFANGYVDVEYWFEDDGYDGSHRIWLPESAVYNLYYGDYSGEQ